MRVLKKAWPTRLTYGVPAGARDGVGHRPGGAHVVEDRLGAGGVRSLAQQRLGQQRGEEVAVDELARVVDEEAAVGVAVPGDPEVGAASRAPRSMMNRRFSGSSGLGSWSGKFPSGVQ